VCGTLAGGTEKRCRIQSPDGTAMTAGTGGFHLQRCCAGAAIETTWQCQRRMKKPSEGTASPAGKDLGCCQMWDMSHASAQNAGPCLTCERNTDPAAYFSQHSVQILGSSTSNVTLEVTLGSVYIYIGPRGLRPAS